MEQTIQTLRYGLENCEPVFLNKPQIKECLEAFYNQMKWNEVGTLRPVNGSWVLAYSTDTGRHIAWFADGSFIDRAEYALTNVTKWMYIPD